MTRVGAFLLVALSGFGLSCGCTALGVSAAGLGGAVVGAGAGAAVKAGTEYQLGGAVARTFAVPLPELRRAALATFERLDIDVERAPDEREGGALVGRARHRTVRMTFEPITDVLTRVRVTVGRSVLRKDVATADEIVRQLAMTADGLAVSASPHPRARR